MLLSHRLAFAIERTSRTISLGINMLDVEELSIRLPFTRDPPHIGAIHGGAICKIFVVETKILSIEEFDALAENMLCPRDWLKGKGGVTSELNGFICIEACSPGRPYLYLNPLGHAYPQYAARLG